jgi:antitoxin component HigA of HigAB toxin-antitoxin module
MVWNSALDDNEVQYFHVSELPQKIQEEYAFSDLSKEFITAMRSRMRILNINQSELARRMGANKAYVSRVLKGKENLTLKTLVKIGIILGVDWKVYPKKREKLL